MESPRSRALIGAAALVVVVALFLILRGGGGGSPTDTTSTAADGNSTTAGGGGQPTTVDSEVPTIVIKDGQPVGGVQKLSFTQGDAIRFTVDSDVADEVHFHGYDVGKDVEAGGSVSFDVPAADAGVFEVELEQRVVPIAEITVNPG
jgi:hypothetical protein